MTPEDLEGKRLALLLMAKSAEGADDWVVFPGIVRREESGLVLERDGEEPVHLQPDWIHRARLTTEETRPILADADVVISLSVATVGAEVAATFENLGLRWPDKQS